MEFPIRTILNATANVARIGFIELLDEAGMERISPASVTRFDRRAGALYGAGSF